ncbi:hypothetical protein D3C76_1394260 [compost metagenome]
MIVVFTFTRSFVVLITEARQGGGTDEFHTVPGRHGRRHQLDLTRVLKVKAQQHGVVFVLSVMAMLHEGAGELAEADRHLDFLGAVYFRSYTIDVFAGPLFPLRWRLAVAVENDPFLEVHMHRVTPAIAAILDLPHFQGAVA